MRASRIADRRALADDGVVVTGGVADEHDTIDDTARLVHVSSPGYVAQGPAGVAATTCALHG